MVLLSSCVYYANPVPDMPYSPHRNAAATAAVPQLQPVQPVTEQLPAVQPQVPASPWMTPATTPPVTPTPALPKPAVSTAITKPVAAPLPTPTVTPTAPKVTTPASKPEPAAATPAGKTTSVGDPSKITNDGPIPVATKVEGDPTRVYNPLDPTKTIRIIDKNGNVFPSGKELKVRGTDYHFYVP